MDSAQTEIDRLSRELAAAQQERSQSAAYGLELLNEKENLQQRYDAIEANYEQAKLELKDLREALEKAVSEQRSQVTTVLEKEDQLLNDSEALANSYTVAIQEIQKELKQTKLLLESAIAEKDRFVVERDELLKRIENIESERKTLKIELKEIKAREAKLFNENSELEEENVSLQKQVSNLRSTQVEFESSKHEIQRLEDEIAALNGQLEDAVNLKRLTERHMKEALEVAHEGLQSEREQKAALRKELDKRNSADPSSINWNSFGSLFDEVHLTEIKKLQQTLEEKDSQKAANNPITNLNGDDIESLKAMLYKKHEQLKQLRTILKSNKESAEVALKNLKSKYDMEKAIVTETMTKLRQDHKRLSEDAATFASIRSQFSSRIEEYNTEIEKLQKQLAASEEEKNTLNSLLRIAIAQKVQINQEKEALEIELNREDSGNKSNSNRGGGGSMRAGNRGGGGGQRRR